MYKYVGCYIECKMLSGLAAFSSLEVEELNVEHQGGVGGDAAGDALGPVAHVRADGQLGSLAPGHLGHSLVPSGDDLDVSNVTRPFIIAHSPLPCPG